MDSSTITLLISIVVVGINASLAILSYRNANRTGEKDNRDELRRDYERVRAERDDAVKERDKYADDLMKLRSLWEAWIREAIERAIEDAVKK